MWASPTVEMYQYCPTSVNIVLSLSECVGPQQTMLSLLLMRMNCFVVAGLLVIIIGCTIIGSYCTINLGSIEVG